MLKLIDAITANPKVNAFRRVGRDGDDVRDWQFDPYPGDVIADADRDGFFVMGAMQIVSATNVRRCYMDVSLPERINDYVYFVAENGLEYDYPHKFEGDKIPAIAIDGFGVYELFYSRIAPELGIDVLKRGLAVSKRKHLIAADLGYILRDERRYREAAEMFQLAVEEEVSSDYIYGELAQIYAKLGDTEMERKYEQLYRRRGS